MRNCYLKNFMLLICLTCFGTMISAQSVSTGVNSRDSNPDGQRFNHVISGQAVFLPGELPFKGLKISFSDVGETTVGADGTYAMEVPRYWSGVATPYVCGGGGYSFDPPQIEYTNVRFDIPDQNYTGEADTAYIISGKFTDKATGEPLANTQIKFNLSGLNQVDEMYVTTNDQGEYSFEKLPCWGDTLDPYLNGLFYFEPGTRGYSGLDTDITNQDYEVINYNYPVPPGWETINTGSFAFIAIESNSDPDVCGVSLEIGDLLGVFYSDGNGDLKCGGFTRWQDENNGFISAQGDDNTTMEKDGFAGGEAYTWKIYSYARQESYPASVDIVSGNNVFYGLGLTKVGGVDGLIENSIFITAGWSGISSYTMPDLFPALITSVMSPVSDEMVIIQDMQKMYYPDAGINTLLLWKYSSGYKIKMNGDAVLPMNGCPEADKSVDLNTTWNLMPVLSECAVPVADFFDPVVDQIILVKEIGGTGIYWPAMNIQSLYLLKPGMAYYVAVSSDVTVNYGDCNTTKQAYPETPAAQNLTSWNDPVKTGSSHSVAIQADATKDFDSGDYLGVFDTAGFCAGLTEIISPRENIVITVFGDDPLTGIKEGFDDGEQMYFRWYRSAEDHEFEILPVDLSQEYPDTDTKFTHNGLSVIGGFKHNSSGIETHKQDIRISPNPARGLINISLHPEEKFLLTITSFSGKQVFVDRINGHATIDLSHLPAGLYLVKVAGAENIFTQKLMIN